MEIVRSGFVIEIILDFSLADAEKGLSVCICFYAGDVGSRNGILFSLMLWVVSLALRFLARSFTPQNHFSRTLRTFCTKSPSILITNLRNLFCRSRSFCYLVL